MTGYTITIENLRLNYAEFEHVYRQHYKEMQVRLAAQGIVKPDYLPDLKTYFEYCDSGGLINYCVRLDGKPIGYSNIYIFADAHNGQLCAQEDTIYVLPEHRNGIGRKLTKFVLSDLERRGVESFQVTAMTDLRAEKLWARLGFKPVATTMIYRFK